MQVECLKLLVDKMHALRREFYNTPLSIHFRQPTIHIMVLFVDEKESVARQLKRGRETKALIEVAARTGRSARCRRTGRRITTSRWPAAATAFSRSRPGRPCSRLKEIFHYHFINAQGPIAEVEENILQRTGIPKHAGTRPPHGGPAPGRARGQPDHHPRPAGTGEAARQLRTGARPRCSPG